MPSKKTSPLAGAVAGKSELSPSSGAVAPLPGTIEHLEMLERAISDEMSFADTPAIDSEPPPPDSDYLRSDDLRGVTFTVVSYEIGPKAFQDQEPKMTATYKLIVKGRADLGMRLLSLQSKHAIQQAKDNLKAGILSFGNVTVDLDDPDSKYPAYILKPAWPKPLRYYHEPWADDNDADKMPKSAAVLRSSLPGKMSARTLKRLAKVMGSDPEQAAHTGVLSSLDDAI